MTLSIFVVGVLIFTILADAFLAVLLYSQPRGNIHTTTLIFHLLCILGWAMSILFILKTGRLEAVQLAYVFGLLIAVSIYYFVKHYTSNLLDISGLNYYWPLPIVISLCVVAFIPGSYVKDFHVIDGAYATVTEGRYAFIYMLVVSYFLIQPIVTLLRCLRSNQLTIRQHQQMKTLFYGISSFFIIGLMTNSVLPVLFDIDFFNGIGPIFSLILAVFIIHNIYRYKFLEIQSLMQRSLIYTLLLVLVVTCYLSFVQIGGLILHNATYLTAVAAGVLTTILGIFTVPAVDRYLSVYTHPLFFKGQFDYSVTLYELSELLQKTLALQEIIDTTTLRLTQVLGASEVCIVLNSESQALSSDFALRLPLITSGHQIGTLYLGDKKSGDDYFRRDRQMLLTLVNQVAVAIERAQLYETVREYTYELEQKVVDRTSEIVTLQLYQRQMLDEISHGLQTPITIITNELTLLSADTKNQPHLSSFKKAIESLSHFIHNLLKLSKLEAPGETLQFTPFSLSKVLEEVMEYSEISLQQPNVTFTKDIDPGVILLGDKKKIEEVVQALLSNAIKYRDPTRTQNISVTLSKEDSYAVIKVHDTGIGIESAHIANIFKRFYRVRDNEHTTDGSGLGLAIVETIIRKHNGSITVDSEKGVRTMFSITLPVAE